MLCSPAICVASSEQGVTGAGAKVLRRAAAVYCTERCTKPSGVCVCDSVPGPALPFLAAVIDAGQGMIAAGRNAFTAQDCAANTYGEGCPHDSSSCDMSCRCLWAAQTTVLRLELPTPVCLLLVPLA
jgi:hypothetical protein